MKQPLVSIIIPIYKVESYLRRCLDSIVRQTYKNLEIILVDDGSPDNCPQICDEYAACDNRIAVIHKKNGGLSEARNTGLDICKGEYISFIDSDDWVEKNYIEFLIKNAFSHQADIVIGNYDLVWDDHSASSEPFQEVVLEKKEVFFQIITAQTTHLGISWGKLYKKRILDGERFPVGKTQEDNYTSYKFIYKANRVCCVDAVLYHYYQRDDSISKTDTSNNFMDVVKEQLDFLIEHKEFELAEFTAIKIGWYWYNQYVKDIQGNKSALHKAKDYYSHLKQIPRFHIINRLKFFFAISIPKFHLLYKKMGKIN